MHWCNTQVSRNNCHTEQVSHFSMLSWYAGLCFDGTIQHFPVFKVPRCLLYLFNTGSLGTSLKTQ